MNTEVQSGIPLPEVKGGGPRSKLGRILSALKVGQSFLTTAKRNTIYSHARYYGITVAVRSQRNKDHGKLRVWRVS